MNRPITTLNPKQRMLADLLALGVDVAKAAEIVGVKASYVRVLLKGSLFGLEIDRSRDKLLAQRRDEFTKALADELSANLEVLKSIRDNTGEKASDRLHAIDTLLSRIVPIAAKNGPANSVGVKLTLSTERARDVDAILTEAKDVTNDDDDGE